MNVTLGSAEAVLLFNVGLNDKSFLGGFNRSQIKHLFIFQPHHIIWSIKLVADVFTTFSLRFG